MVKKCVNCGKTVNKVIGAFKPEEIASTPYESVYCCSKACADKINEETEREIKEMQEGYVGDEWGI